MRGEEIPISAQVVSLADVYDALTSERCYKKAYSHDEALNMIFNGQCGAFNPIFPNIPAKVFQQKLERIRGCIDNLNIDGFPDIHVSISIGGTYGMEKPKELFKIADRMLYEAKTIKNKAVVRLPDTERDHR